MLLHVCSINRMGVNAGSWTQVEKSRLQGFFSRGCGYSLRAPPVLCPWGLRVAALGILPWLIKNPLLELRSFIAVYSSFTCSPLFSMWLFLTTSGSSQLHSLFHNTCGSVQESWMSMLVQCRWIWCFTALGYQMVKSYHAFRHSCVLFQQYPVRLLLQASPPAVLSSLNNFVFMCVVQVSVCLGFCVSGYLGGVWWLVRFGFVLVLLLFLRFSFVFWASCKDWNLSLGVSFKIPMWKLGQRTDFYCNECIAFKGIVSMIIKKIKTH